MDGKTLRGSGHGGQDSPHLLAAPDHAHGVVLSQVGVDVKTNEIPVFSALLDGIEITDAVTTADVDFGYSRGSLRWIITPLGRCGSLGAWGAWGA